MYFKDSNERDSDCIQRKVSNCNPSHSVQGDDLDDLMMTCDSSYLRQDGGCSRQGREELEVVAGLPPHDYLTAPPCGQTGPPRGAEKEDSSASNVRKTLCYKLHHVKSEQC